MEKEIIKPEGAEELFAELSQGVNLSPDYQQVYDSFNRTFHKTLDLNIRQSRVVLAGPFAKTDYLLKEHRASSYLRRVVNEARIRLRRKDEPGEMEMGRHYKEDFKALCLFVSLLYGVPVPADMARYYPADQPTNTSPLLYSDYLRVIVNRWDESFIYCVADNVSIDEIKISFETIDHKEEMRHDYLRDMMRVGSQLNLIRPRADKDVLYAEYIILEPDYLVDISSIASCFESYSNNPVLHLLGRLKPVENTEATVLGNFASQLLDEVIHGEHRSYTDSVKDFFKKNSISLLTASITPTFHTQAKSQLLHIQEAIGTALPRHTGSFNASEVILEPSFFSEMLGLQGRMDLLQIDHRVMIEQKSGKGGFPPVSEYIPRYQEKHYVQTLLYMWLLRYQYRDQYEHIDRESHAFLLYSKYVRGLVGVGFAPQLVAQALRVRNGIVCQDYRLAEGDYGRLFTLTPESLREKPVTDNFWNGWIAPQLASLLRPLHTCSPLERDYFARFLGFVAREHLLSKVGNKTKENSGFASIWQCTLDEKLHAGNIYHQLRLLHPNKDDQGKVSKVVLHFSEREDHDMSNFRRGDIVILYPYDEGTTPDARGSMVYRCSIEQINKDTLVLSLRTMQVDSHVFMLHRNQPWAIEHDFHESSSTPLFRGLYAFLSAPKERKDLILMQRQPRIDESRRLKGDYGDFNELMLRVKQAVDLFLIIGPPGTGKTSYGMLYTLKEALTEKGDILILSYTNRAVDEICSKLEESDIGYLRIGSAINCSPEYRHMLLSERVADCPNITAIRILLDNTRVIVGTSASLQSQINLLQVKSFSLAIIDEASQLLEPHLLGLLSASTNGVPSIAKIVMIGDHKQLPAVVQQTKTESNVVSPQLRSIGLTDCRRSLFERLLERYRQDPKVVYMLTRQGRMHKDIAQFPNKAFYGGKLQVVPLPHQEKALACQRQLADPIDIALFGKRVAFIHVDAPVHCPSDKVNPNEALLIATMVVKVYKHLGDLFSVSESIGVIVPYRNQIAAIRTQLAKYAIPELDEITIDTVERYQGSQRDYIIYGFTVQRYYQLSFLTDGCFMENGKVIDRKLNVAMTRAREHLVMVGNKPLLRNHAVYADMLEEIEEIHEKGEKFGANENN